MPCSASGTAGYIQYCLLTLRGLVLLQEVAGVLYGAMDSPLATWHFLQEFPVAPSRDRVTV